jgi:hypothetical protein
MLDLLGTDMSLSLFSSIVTCFEIVLPLVSKGPKGFKQKPLNGEKYFSKPILNKAFFLGQNASKIIPRNHNMGKM